ncbi:MAG: hypothetical protein ACRDD1_21320, partial [Planctomycetia bacterium]
MTRFTRPVMGLFAAALLAAPVAPARAAEVDPLLPVETEAVMFLNVRQILDCELVKKFALGQLKQALQGQDAQKMIKQLGVDPLKDVETLVAGTWGKDPKNMQVVAVLYGKFNPEKLFAAATDATKDKPDEIAIVTEGKYKLVKFTPKTENPDQKPFYVAVADEETLIAGSDAKLVTTAVAAAEKDAKPVLGKELSSLILAQDDKASMYACGLTAGKVDVPANLNLPGVDGAKLAKQLENMKSLAMTLRMTKDVAVEIGMGMKDEDSADDFAGT